jgi:hypothetical protein
MRSPLHPYLRPTPLPRPPERFRPSRRSRRPGNRTMTNASPVHARRDAETRSLAGAGIKALIRMCAAGVLCATLAACGSSTHTTSSTSSTLAATPTAPNTAKLVRARVAAASCMRAQGVNIPDPGIGRASVLNMLRVLSSYPRAKIQAAEIACAAQIHQAFPNATSLTPAERAQRLQEAVAFAACMRSHGINFPDPTTAVSDPSGYYQALQSINVSSPAVKTAGKTCAALTLRHVGG